MEHKEQETSHFRAQAQTQGPTAVVTQQRKRERSHLLAFPFQDCVSPAVSVPPVLRYLHPFLHWNASGSADRGGETRLATRTDAFWTTNALKIDTGKFHNDEPTHTDGARATLVSTFMRADKKGTPTRMGHYQQRKPPLMITNLKYDQDLTKYTKCTTVQTKGNPNKMIQKEVTRRTIDTGHHPFNRDWQEPFKTRTTPHKNRWRKHYSGQFH